jgi:hypothetical protein
MRALNRNRLEVFAIELGRTGLLLLLMFFLLTSCIERDPVTSNGNKNEMAHEEGRRSTEDG